jgi:phytoene dehydrogenase-like protein
VADASYDAVVIGGGHHGTIIACYLQNAGMQTAIFERQHELGGGACTEEYVLPGFLAQPCAHRTRFYGHPAFEDFNLVRNGLYPIKAKVSDYSGCCPGADSDMSASSIPSTTEVST